MTAECPDEQTLVDFASGRLAEARASQLERHLETCVTCPAVMAALDDVGGAPAAAPDDVTREAEGRYELQRELGEGAEGRVWLAWDHHLGRAVALKLSHREGDRALREARLVARLNHPGIVTVFEIGRRADGSLYSAQRLVRAMHGPASLREALTRARTLEDRLRLLPRLLQACEAVGHAHARGVVHRDLKPEHIALGDDGETVVIDWGLAVHEDERGATHGPVGTRGYRSPEQEAGAVVDATSDVFSLGVVLREVVDVAPHEPTLAPLLAIVARACHVDPPQRYATASALAEELTRFLSGGRVRAHEYALTERAARAFRRHRLAVSLLGVVALVSAVAALVIAHSRAQTRDVLVAALLQRGEVAQTTGGADVAALFAASALELRDSEPARLMLAANTGRSLLSARATVWSGEPVVALAWHGATHRLAVASATGQVAVWDRGATTARTLARAHQAGVSALVFSPDGRALYSSGLDGRFVGWDPESGTSRVLFQTTTELQALNLSPDGSVAALADERGAVQVLSLPDGAPRARWQAHTAPIYTLAVDPSGRWLATGTWRGEVATWAWDGAALGTFRAHQDAVIRLAASPDGQLLASSSRDRTVRVWKVDAPDAPPMTLLGHSRRVVGVAWLDRRTLVSTADDGQVRSWAVSLGEVGSGNKWQCLSVDQLGGAGLALVAVDQAVVAGTEDGALVRVEWPRALRVGMPWRERISHLDVEDAGVLLSEGDFFVHRDPRTAAIVDREPAPHRLWQVRALHGGRRAWIGYDQGAEVVMRRDADGGVVELERSARLWNLLVDRDERWLGTLGHRKEVTLHPFDGGAPVTLSGHTSDVFAADLGTTLAVTGSYDTTVGVYALPSGERLHTLRGHWHGVRAVALSDDESLIASGSWDQTVRLWDARSGALLTTFRGPESYVTAVALSPRGRLASISWDGTLFVWDVATHTALLRLDGVENEPRTLRWDGETALLVGGSRFNRVELSPPSTSVAALARERGLRLDGVELRRDDFGVLLR